MRPLTPTQCKTLKMLHEQRELYHSPGGSFDRTLRVLRRHGLADEIHSDQWAITALGVLVAHDL